jgi:hypothetical protein
VRKASLDTLNIFKDFDESAYLMHNPDVSAAVDNQAFSSGMEHFIKFGIFENRPGLLKTIKDLMDRLNVEVKHPPKNLRLRIHGDEVLQEFTNAGKFVSYNPPCVRIVVASFETQETEGRREMTQCKSVIQKISKSQWSSG